MAQPQVTTHLVVNPVSVKAAVAAEMVGVSVQTVYRDIRAKRLRTVPHLEGVYVIPVAELDRVYGVPALGPLAEIGVAS